MTAENLQSQVESIGPFVEVEDLLANTGRDTVFNYTARIPSEKYCNSGSV
jgi:hypothetical protein